MKILVVFGTRPEGIKMAPIIKELQNRKNIECISIVTSQHRELLDEVLETFKIVPDYDLSIFENGQTLTDITTKSLKGLEDIIKKEKPDILLVQGDTTTVFAGALAAFYQKIKIGHIEAGLRSGNIMSPWPEEANRKLTGILTKYHFAPTEVAKENLLRENYPEEDIFITGNTVIDALHMSIKSNYIFNNQSLNDIDYNKKIILLTSHRRENLGMPMERIFTAINNIVKEYEDVEVIFPMHPNPRIREIAKTIFGDSKKVHCIEPLNYFDMANLLKKIKIVVTDSGGLQEEAPALGVPVLVVREETERPEGIIAGTAKLVGTEEKTIYSEIKKLLDNSSEYEKMAKAVNPYGDGKAAVRIANILEEKNN